MTMAAIKKSMCLIYWGATLISGLFHRTKRRKSNIDPLESSNTSRSSISCCEVTCELEKMPKLYHLPRASAWEEVAHRAESDPYEARADLIDHAGDTILHTVCCNKPPVETVQALLKACPGLARVRNGKDHLPLHVASSHRASDEVIKALIHAYPEASGKMNGAGSYTLHVLCDYGCSVDTIQCILETEGGAKSARKTRAIFRRTPLYMLNGRKNLPEFKRSLQTLRQTRQKQHTIRQSIHGSHDESILMKAEVELRNLESLIEPFHKNDFWRKASMLVLAQYLKRALTEQDLVGSRIVHACVGIDNCPPSLLEYAILLNMNELVKKDHKGRSPLHIAASAAKDTTVATIAMACPEAARISDNRGRLVLKILLSKRRPRGWSPGLEQVIVANPEAIETLDLDEKLYPFIWNRLGQIPTGKGLDELYKSVRAKPSLFKEGRTVD
jgi:hypothetical protein